MVEKKWQIQLEGDHRALFEMSKALEGSTLALVFDKTRGEFVLESARLQSLKALTDVEQVAAEEVATLNALLHLEHGRPSSLVRLAGLQQVDENGNREIHVHQDEAADARSFADADRGVMCDAPRAHRAAVQIRMRDSDATIAKVLRLYGASKGASWSDLWPIAELIWDDLGGRKPASKILQMKEETERFGATANNPHVAGDKARHGVFKEQPPRNPMALPEGQAYVDLLIQRWLATKAT